MKQLEPGSPEQHEAALLAGCLAGDRAALRALYDEHVHGVLRAARRLGVPPADAEDVAQEVFAAAFRGLHKVQPGSLSAWLFRLTSNRAHDWHRRRRVRDLFAALLHPMAEPQSPSNPERELLRADSEARMAHILGRMSRKKREVFVLFEIEKLSGNEIAAQLGVPVKTVWSRLDSARDEFMRIARSLDFLEQARSAGVAR